MWEVNKQNIIVLLELKHIYKLPYFQLDIRSNIYFLHLFKSEGSNDLWNSWQDIVGMMISIFRVIC